MHDGVEASSAAASLGADEGARPARLPERSQGPQRQSSEDVLLLDVRQPAPMVWSAFPGTPLASLGSHKKPMGYEAKKTEHSGPKRGNGAYWGPKQDAKKESNKIRRRNAASEIRRSIEPTSFTTRVAYCPQCRLPTTQRITETPFAQTAAKRWVGSECERCGAQGRVKIKGHAS